MAGAEPRELTRRGALLLFLVFLAWPLLLVSNSGPAMADSVLLAAMRLVDRGTWTLDDGSDPAMTFQTRAHDISVSGGRLYSGLGPGATIAAVPVYALLEPAFSLFDDGIITNRRVLEYYRGNARAFGMPPGDHFLALYLLQIAMTWILIAPLFAWFLLRLFRRLTEGATGPPQALAVTLAAGFGSMALCYASMYSRQALAYLLIWHALLSLTGRVRPGPWIGAAAGAAAGLAVAVDYPSLILVAVALPFPLLRLGARGRIAVVAPLAALLALTALYHFMIFGSPLATPYHHRYWHTAGYLTQRGIDLAAFQAGPTAGVGLPDPSVMLRLCFGNYKGIFLYSPVLLLGLIGNVAGARGAIRPRLHLMSLLIFACYLTFNSTLGSGMAANAHHFWGGLSVLWGPRYLFAVIPFLAWGIIRLDWKRPVVRVVTWTALAVSCLFNVSAALFSHIIIATPAFGPGLEAPLLLVMRLLATLGPRVPLLDVYGAPPMLQWGVIAGLLTGSVFALRSVVSREAVAAPGR
jgi:hypothetical protein